MRTLSDAPHQPLSADLAALAQAGVPRGVDLKEVTASGHAIALSDQQVLINSKMKDFPSEAATLEFWMRTVDKCHRGTPFSYATGTGEYAVSDNRHARASLSNPAFCARWRLIGCFACIDAASR